MAKRNSVTSYFPHDSNARNSDKIIRLRMRHKSAGYGVYFMILERLREEPNYMSVKDYNMIAFDLREDASLIKSVVEDFGLFVFTEDGKYFYSESFKRRMEIKDEKNKKRSEAGKIGLEKRWNKSEKIAKDTKSVANATKNDSNAIANVSENDSKERKEKESNNTFSDEKDITISSSGEEECDSLPRTPSAKPSETASEKIPLQEIADMWNAICPNLSKVERITDKRKRKIPVRVKEMGGWEKARPLLEEIFRKVQRSNFLNGDNDRGWTCSFDWIFENGTHWVNIHEGRYDNTRPRPIERRSSIDVSALTQRQTNFYNFLLRNGEFLLNMPVFPTDEEIGNLNSIPKPELTEIVKEINNKTYLLNGRTSIYETIMEIRNKRYGT